MLKLNLLPTDEIKEICTKHEKTLKLLSAILACLLILASILVVAKLYSLNATQKELSTQLAELTSFEANQKDTLDALHKKQEKILTHITKTKNNIDVAQFLRLLVHLKNKNTAIYEIKAEANQVEFAGFSNNRSSIIEFSEQLKKSSNVQKIANFMISKPEKNSKQQNYPLAFNICVMMKRGGELK